ncbi:hypothetical protein B484DRAFT_459885, partial [Ochromonadaceae sp. CCMP2298]
MRTILLLALLAATTAFRPFRVSLSDSYLSSRPLRMAGVPDRSDRLDNISGRSNPRSSSPSPSPGPGPSVDEWDPVVSKEVDRSLLGLLLVGLGLFAYGSITTSYALDPLAVANSAADSVSVFDPALFQPICPASDGVYNGLKGLIGSAIGGENLAQFGPLIAGVLLRVRLELCVFESFLYEAVVPFIKLKGLSWVLPLHETVETFVAGTVFAVASNFILLGSTKVFAVLLIYADALLGLPTRTIAWLLKRIPVGKPATERVGKGFEVVGELIGNVRKAVEIVDTFVGRYLV